MLILVATFLSGMVTMGFLVASLFFFRFWNRTRDRLFALFGVAFLLMAVNQLFTHVSGPATQDFFYAYVLRIIAYVMLIAGIVAKNLEQRDPRQV